MRRVRLESAPSALYGFSYVEILVAITLITILLVPALQALQTGIQGSDIHREETIGHYYLAGRFEAVLAQSYADLLAEANAVGDETVPTAYSDAAGDSNRRLVFLSTYDVLDSDADGDPFTGGDGSLLWVRIQLENTARAMESLTSVYE